MKSHYVLRDQEEERAREKPSAGEGAGLRHFHPLSVAPVQAGHEGTDAHMSLKTAQGALYFWSPLWVA